MQWWFQILIGVVWCTAVVIITSLSLSGATKAIDEGLATDPSSGQMAIALVSAVVFAIPGIGFITVGLRKRGRSRS